MKETRKINNRLKYRKWYERSAKRKHVSFFAYTPREKSHFRLAKRETRNENPFRIHSNLLKTFIESLRISFSRTLIGTIPESIGQLASTLKSLDLSECKFGIVR
jgi:hypothetical protein